MLPIDWRQSPAHLVFLATFFKPRGRDEASPGNVDWKLLLGEEPKQAVDRFIRDGAIRALYLDQLLDHRYKIPDLKEPIALYLPRPPGVIFVWRLMRHISIGRENQNKNMMRDT